MYVTAMKQLYLIYWLSRPLSHPLSTLLDHCYGHYHYYCCLSLSLQNKWTLTRVLLGTLFCSMDCDADTDVEARESALVQSMNSTWIGLSFSNISGWLWRGLNGLIVWLATEAWHWVAFLQVVAAQLLSFFFFFFFTSCRPSGRSLSAMSPFE